MSAVEREIELVAGTIGGITQKKADTWTVAVTPADSQYAKNLWTKDVDLVESLAAKIGQAGAFVCGASYWERDGKQVRSLWIDSVENADAVEAISSVATPVAAARIAAPQAKASGDVDWDAKERRDYRSRAWAQTLGAFNHTINVEEDPIKVFQRLHPFQQAVYRDVVRGLYQPDDDDVPFE
jgi:hypothetical protein